MTITNYLLITKKFEEAEAHSEKLANIKTFAI